MSGLQSAPPREKIPRFAELDLVLVTARLRLRPIEESDVDDLFPYVSDPEFPRMLSWYAHTERSQTLEYIRHVRAALVNNTAVTWVIEHDGRAIGCIGLDGIEFQVRAWRVDRAEIGYWIAPPMWSQGLMTEAAHAVMGCGFEVIGLHKITVGCIVENVASRRVIEKLGFRMVGRQEEDAWRDGRWLAMLSYELTAPEWSDVSTTMRVQRPAL